MEDDVFVTKEFLDYEVRNMLWNFSLNYSAEPFVMGDLLREIAGEFDEGDCQLVEEVMEVQELEEAFKL